MTPYYGRRFCKLKRRPYLPTISTVAAGILCPVLNLGEYNILYSPEIRILLPSGATKADLI